MQGDEYFSMAFLRINQRNKKEVIQLELELSGPFVYIFSPQRGSLLNQCLSYLNYLEMNLE